MKAKVKTQNKVETREEFYDRVSRFMAILYENRQLKIEGEKKVFLYRLNKATKGKKIILEIDRKFLDTITSRPLPSSK